ncbi:hypothetical protein SGPA1_40046 [Streptomyces misionensis JCM 4497]
MSPTGMSEAQPSGGGAWLPARCSGRHFEPRENCGGPSGRRRLSRRAVGQRPGAEPAPLHDERFRQRRDAQPPWAPPARPHGRRGPRDARRLLASYDSYAGARHDTGRQRADSSTASVKPTAVSHL